LIYKIEQLLADSCGSGLHSDRGGLWNWSVGWGSTTATVANRFRVTDQKEADPSPRSEAPQAGRGVLP
jgi:hypothetical protein